LEVDVRYPAELHAAHNQLPFLCERRCPPGTNQEKLVTTLYDRKKYIVHFAALQQVVNHGLEVTRTRRAIKFSQSRWFKAYVEYNANLQKLADALDLFDKEFRKFMNNGPYGKSMEKRRHIILM
jgi:hypothetical protein